LTEWWDVTFWGGGGTALRKDRGQGIGTKICEEKLSFRILEKERIDGSLERGGGLGAGDEIC